ncbi:MAG: hypothetical protein M3N10_09455 [Actinomycetota bacterium]|nr:hypothetical protein [Actinomycetota bacterium]
MNEDEAGAQREEYPGQDHKRLEEAGWELVERNSQKILWRNPESGRLYPQGAAIKLIRK